MPTNTSTTTSQVIEITLPADQLEGTSATLSRWLVTPGSPVKAGEPLLELETDKVSMEVSAPADGVLETVLVEPGDVVEPEMVLGRLAQAGTAVVTTDELAATGTDTAAAAPAKNPAPAEADNARHLIGPAVRSGLHAAEAIARGTTYELSDVQAYSLRSGLAKRALEYAIVTRG